MFLHFDIRLGIMVVVVALIQGGRYERLIGALFALRGALNLLAPKWDWDDVADWERLIAFQSAFLILCAAIAWRHRRPWLTAIVALQAGSVALAIWCATHPHQNLFLQPAFYVLALGKSAALAWAVARRWIGPPRAPPGSGDPDPDLFAIAARRGTILR